MPAPIAAVPPSVPDSGGKGAPAAAAGANEVSFEGVLAAQLAQLSGTAPDADSVPSAASDVSKSAATVDEDQKDDREASARLASSVQASLPVAAPMPAPQQPVATVPAVTATSTDTTPETSAAQRLDALISRPSPAPRPGGPTLQQAEPAGRVVTSAAADPAPGLPEAARIAAPADGAVARPTPFTAGAELAEVKPLTDTHPSDPGDQRGDPATAVMAGPPERAESVARNLPQPAQLNVAAPVGSSGFAPEVGDRLVWMATNNHQVAALRIDPPQLGPVEVHLSLSNDQANLSIVSPHAAVREALQASLPRLHDMLQGLGINLSSVSIGAEAFGHGGFGQAGQGAEASGYALPMQARALSDHPPVATTSGFVTLRSGSGVIDVYA